VRHLLQLAIHVQQTLRAKLLTPAEELKKTYTSLLALPDTGLAKLLHANQFGDSESNALGMRGAGTCFSFATRKQAWDDEPDLQNENGEFHVQGYGLAVLDLGRGPALYAGGEFKIAGGVGALNIARWNAANWAALGSGMDNEVLALTVHDDVSGPALYAGGSFTTASGTAVGHVASQGFPPTERVINGLTEQALG